MPKKVYGKWISAVGEIEARKFIATELTQAAKEAYERGKKQGDIRDVANTYTNGYEHGRAAKEAYEAGKAEGHVTLTSKEIYRNGYNAALKEVEALVAKHDPRSGDATNPVYWGNTLRAAIATLKSSKKK